MDEPAVTPALEARRLLRAARAGTLATATGGQPYASLITPATAPDGSVLMLLSGLSDHTKHLRADGRCAVMVQGEGDGINAQTAPRLTVLGTARPEPDPALKARWITLHPYAAFYAGFEDFSLWRLHPEAGHYIGGFARAFRVTAADLLPSPEAVAAMHEELVITQSNTNSAGDLDAIAAAHGLPGEGWRMVACDPDGFDLQTGETVRRIHFPETIDSPNAARATLADLASAAKK